MQSKMWPPPVGPFKPPQEQKETRVVSYYGTKEELVSLNLTEIVIEHKSGDIEATVDFLSPDARVITARLDADRVEALRDVLTAVLSRIQGRQ